MEDNNEPVASLKVGDNFVVVVAPGNNEGVDFFILQCIKQMHIMQEDVGLDDWGNFVEKGDEIVIIIIISNLAQGNHLMC